VFRHLLTRREASVEYLTLNRPEVRNAFNDEMIGELADWAEELRAASDVRAVVIDGAGKSFSAGADVTWMAKTVRYSEEENLRDAMAASQMFSSINTLPCPVIGKVHGAALGGGAGVVACCDIAVASTDTVFGFTEVKLGISPAVISPFVIEKIGRSAARELFLTGARFSAQRAHDLGLVHAVVTEPELDDVVARFVAEILSGGPEAIAAAKALIATVSHAPLDQVSGVTAGAIARRRVSAEGQEGLTAFLEKRKPRWSRA
jgi:methylglutaconyl-CoA hydratase